MARYTGTVSSPHPVEAVWPYLADLRSTAEWDPSIERVERTEGKPGAPGSRYRLEMSFLGRRLALPYVTVEAEAPRRVLFAAEGHGITVRDEARIEPSRGGGSTVTWDADLRLRGPRRLLDPLLGLAFTRLGDRARRGLADRLAGPAPPVVAGEADR